jgi:hypothetical protein
MEENKGGFMGFMIHWTSGRIIKPVQIENIELYRTGISTISSEKLMFLTFIFFVSKNKSQDIGNDYDTI